MQTDRLQEEEDPGLLVLRLPQLPVTNYYLLLTRQCTTNFAHPKLHSLQAGNDYRVATHYAFKITETSEDAFVTRL